jgi:hypothetical protein
MFTSTCGVAYNYKLCDHNAFICDIQSVPLLDLFSRCSDVHEMWLVWCDIVSSAVEKNVPKATLTHSCDPPWFDGEVRHSLNRRDTAHRKAKRTNTTNAWSRYHSIRNSTQTLIRSKHTNFINSLAVSCTDNPKRFWSYFKQKTSSKSIPTVVRNDQVESENPTIKAQMFNNYFASVFNNNTPDQQPTPPQLRVATVPA